MCLFCAQRFSYICIFFITINVLNIIKELVFGASEYPTYREKTSQERLDAICEGTFEGGC
jgi:hypothetical protein